VEVTVEPDAAGDRWAVVRVRDHGIGIPSQDVERIFSQFFRAASQQ
jgi:signal transduction histidine kinase